MLELVRLAASQNITLHGTHLDDDVLGYWSPDERRIYFDLALTHNERRSTIAHELGHAHYGHRESTPANERQADRYAANLLISPEEYARLEALNSDQHYLADELGVTVDLINVFEQQCLTKLRGVTYARARHGIAQAAFRHFTRPLEVTYG